MSFEGVTGLLKCSIMVYAINGGWQTVVYKTTCCKQDRLCDLLEFSAGPSICEQRIDQQHFLPVFLS